jgi:hypothetical protein
MRPPRSAPPPASSSHSLASDPSRFSRLFFLHSAAGVLMDFALSTNAAGVKADDSATFEK